MAKTEGRRRRAMGRQIRQKVGGMKGTRDEEQRDVCVEEEEGAADDGKTKLPFKTKTGMSNKVARRL